MAAAVTGLWGVAHAVPTKQVAAGFEPVTRDNRRVIIQEWLAESITMWGIAAVIVAVTVTGAHGVAAASAYRVLAGVLIAIAVLTMLTGARTRVVWLKVCPALMTTSAALLIVASVVG